MADNLRLRIVLDMAERVLAPMRRISASSTAAAQALKAAKEKLKELGEQQKQVGQFRQLKQGLQETSAKMAEAQAKVASLARAHRAAGPPTVAMTREFEAAKRAAAALGQQHTTQQAQLQQLRTRLTAAGINTRELGQHERRLRAEMTAANAAIERQTARLRANAEQQRRLTQLTQAHGRAMMKTAAVGGAGAAMMFAGSKIAAPLRGVVNDFMPAEVEETQLKIAFMQADGSVVPELKQIVDLATRLGDKLPGTTADFIHMMTVLRKEGMSAQAVLGGLGESAANLGVLMQVMPQEAAAKMAKMQDSLSATEQEMREVADLMQRANYLGANMAFMQSAIGNAAPVMDVLKVKGAQAMRVLAPMAVMMNQAGMEDGGSVGNAVRKIVDRAMDAKKVGKANAALKDAGAGFKLNFTDGKGEFGGLEKMYAQLDKLRKLSTQDRGMVINALWGDDAETNRVLTKWINDNLDGYAKTVAKMQAQANLQLRVNAQLDTVAAKLEAAQGSFSNMKKEFGEAIAPELKDLLDWLGSVANGVGKWARENPRLAKGIMLTVAAISVLLSVAGALTLAIASVVAPFLLVRFAFKWMALAMFGARTGAAGAGLGMRLLTGALKLLRAGAMIAGRAILFIGRALLMNPIGLMVTAIAIAAFLIYKYWGPIKEFFSGLWDSVKASTMAAWESVKGFFSGLWNDIKAGAAAVWQDLGGSTPAALATIGTAIANWSPLGLFYRAFVGVMGWFGIELPAKFSTFGANLISGLVGGITSGLGGLKDTVVGVASSVGGWFKEKLGINSPSRVFMEYGGWVSEGAALGIAGGAGAVRNAALGMATAATMAMPMAAGAAALQLDTRPPMGAAAAAAPGGAGGNTYSITINPAPGMDAQAIARAVSAELDRRERSKKSRSLSALHDID